MDKNTFNALDLIKQLEYVNKELENNSLRSISKSIGIDKSTISARLKKIGFKYNDEQKQYIKDNSINTENTINTNTKKAYKPKINTTNINVSDDKIKSLELKIEALEKQVNTIINTINTTNTNVINTNLFKGDTVVRAYRIYEDVQEEFKKFCKKHQEYKVQDLISTALVEFMNKHNQINTTNTINTNEINTVTTITTNKD